MSRDESQSAPVLFHSPELHRGRAPVRWRPGLRFALVLWLVPGHAACQAPKAVALQGGAAEAIRKGIETGKGAIHHGAFDRVLRMHALEMGRRFDYRGLKKHPEDLDLYLEEIGKARLADLGRDELAALLVNAYNAYTIQSILETLTPARPEGVKSIRDIPGVFDNPTHRVGGFDLSLNNIEHNLLRPLFKDPRIHFVVNCASISCPPLPSEALKGGQLESQLEYAARGVLSSPDYVRIEDGKLKVAKLLEWYGSDFVTPGFHGAEASLPAYLRKYASDEVARFIDSAGGSPPLSYLDYDWSLNRSTKIPLQDQPF